MEWKVLRTGNPDVEREHLNKILKEISTSIGTSTPTASSSSIDFNDTTTISFTQAGNTWEANVRTASIGPTHLVSTAVTAGSYGDDDSVPSFTVDADGRLTAAADVQLPYVVYLTTGTGGLSALDFVAVNSSGEAVKAKADSEATKAIGYVKSAFSAAATAKVYLLKGTLTGLSGLTIGTQYYLDSSTAGGITDSPTFTADHIIQYVGLAYSSTALGVDIGPAREVGL